jgi:hypothetical protein
MTEERMAPLEFVRKGGEQHFLRQLLQFPVAPHGVRGQGALWSQRTEDRTNSRNYRERQWQNSRGHARAVDPQAAAGHLLPERPGTAQSLREVAVAQETHLHVAKAVILATGGRPRGATGSAGASGCWRRPPSGRSFCGS